MKRSEGFPRGRGERKCQTWERSARRRSLSRRARTPPSFPLLRSPGHSPPETAVSIHRLHLLDGRPGEVMRGLARLGGGEASAATDRGSRRRRGRGAGVRPGGGAPPTPLRRRRRRRRRGRHRAAIPPANSSDTGVAATWRRATNVKSALLTCLKGTCVRAPFLLILSLHSFPLSPCPSHLGGQHRISIRSDGQHGSSAAYRIQLSLR